VIAHHIALHALKGGNHRADLMRDLDTVALILNHLL